MKKFGRHSNVRDITQDRKRFSNESVDSWTMKQGAADILGTGQERKRQSRQKGLGRNSLGVEKLGDSIRRAIAARLVFIMPQR